MKSVRWIVSYILVASLGLWLAFAVSMKFMAPAHSQDAPSNGDLPAEFMKEVESTQVPPAGGTTPPPAATTPPPAAAETQVPLQVVGILWDVRTPRAMIRDPDGAVFVVTKNSKVGRSEGFVATIREGEVVVVETKYEDGKAFKEPRVMELKK
ncbi:pilus assembly protein PilP [Bdellovibrio bacteriovorus]|uniref:pilus assembly protein PilP n=1 Tax=Bdellovibrio bacteriovorus TaxID=959 RepID=UPI0021D06349|nr:pilus assembly protein PilP [Bdellovibrio bacteriovorus]UXR64639.1 pilus assembly protein PilP [Bdellovibrio bacteriovorus]